MKRSTGRGRQLKLLQTKPKYGPAAQKPKTHAGTPSYLDAINNAASLFHAGTLEEAERACRDILKVQANDFNALHLLGLVKAQQGDQNEGLLYVDQALRAGPNSYQALNNRGNALQALHRHSEALDSYARALALNPDYAAAHYNRGNALQALQRYTEAIDSYDKAFSLKPDYAEALNNRGNALQALDRPSEAIECYEEALALTPDYAEALYNRGVALESLKRYIEAIESYDMALAIEPDYVEVLNNRGNALQALERRSEAIASYDKALALEPDRAEAFNNRGVALQALKHHSEAIESYDKALSLRADYAEALNNRGIALHALKRHSEALESYDKALSLRPAYAESLSNRGMALQAVKRYSEAIESYDEALSIKPGYAEALSNRGLSLQALQRHSEAVSCYDLALSLKPDYPDALNNRGRALQVLGHHSQARESYDKALSLQPQHADALLNKGLLLLLLGELNRGWPLYEARWKASDAPDERAFAKPLWLGQEDIAGRRLLLHAEQGFGDTIQFCRYAKAARSAGATVVLEVPQPLTRLLRSMEGASEVVARRDQSIQYDLHCPLLSLPLAFQTVLDTIPCETPYLKAEEEWLAKWSAKLGVTDDLRVGLVWSGSTLHGNDYSRSIPLPAFSSLFSLRVDWICLQNQLRSADDAELGSLPSMRHFEKDIQDFSDTAALVELCDLVITVDTAVAHLAGALGKPLWLLLPFAPDWRWMLEREDSPWYPTAKLFRQPAIGDWDSVIHRVKQDLESRLEQDCLFTPERKVRARHGSDETVQPKR